MAVDRLRWLNKAATVCPCGIQAGPVAPGLLVRLPGGMVEPGERREQFVCRRCVTRFSAADIVAMRRQVVEGAAGMYASGV